MIKNIIFDLGGVLIDWNPKYVYRTIFKTEEEVDWFIENITTMEWNVEQDAGRPISEANDYLISKFPEHADHIMAYYGRWEEMLGGPILENVKLLRELTDSKKYKMLALTNWSAETFPVAIERYDFLQLFQGIVVSGIEKCKKPEAMIYNILIDRYGINPSESVFIDDNHENIIAAQNLGIKTVHSISPSQVAQDLRIILSEQ
jgi:2-haloacid dehalogenase